MGTVSKKHTFSAGNTILSAQVNENFDDIYNEFNGSITNDNIDGSAAIEDTKLAQITTAGKVSVTAITGFFPSANIDAVLALTDAASITTDAAVATIFTVTIAADRTLANPTNPTDGMKRVWRISQDATGYWVITLDTDFRVVQELLSGGFGGTFRIDINPSSTTYIGAIYNGTDSKWDIVAYGSRAA